MTSRPDLHAQFEALVSRYSRLIGGIVYRVARRSGDLVRGDIEQKVKLALWRHIESEQTIDYPASYIYRIAIREAVRVIRHEASQEARRVLDEQREARVRQQQDPYESVVRREQRD